MNNKIRQNYEDLAQSLGFCLDVQSGVLYGELSGYSILLYAQNSNYPYMLSASVSAQRPMGALTKEECKRFNKGNKAVCGISQKNSVITVTIRNSPKLYKLKENVAQALDALVSFLSAEGFRGCCAACGAEESSPCFVEGNCVHLCSDCFSKMQLDGSVGAARKKGKQENVVGGIVGALIGSLLGVASIVIFSQMGFIAAVSGIIMAVCTIKGYELLGGKISKKGVIISVVLMILMTYIGDRLDWAILVSGELGVDWFSAFRSIPGLLGFQMIDRTIYIANLAMQYLFVVVGAIPTILNVLKSSHVEGMVYRLGSAPSTYQNL